MVEPESIGGHSTKIFKSKLKIQKCFRTIFNKNLPHIHEVNDSTFKIKLSEKQRKEIEKSLAVGWAIERGQRRNETKRKSVLGWAIASFRVGAREKKIGFYSPLN